MPIVRLALAALLACSIAVPAAATERRKVIIDQDAFEGPGLQPVLMLLNDPSVEVLGITVVSGDGWAPEETAATLRMLELTGHGDVPVIQGAVQPLINSKERNRRHEALYGVLPYKGAWMDSWPAYNTMQRRLPHAPEVVPPLPEGMPALRAAPGSAAEFLLRITARYPGRVSIVTMGPLTNLALAQRLDEGFAARVKEVIVEGGSFLPPPISDAHDEFAMQGVYAPRLSFNQQWDPEAAHIVFATPWRRLVLVASDANAGIVGTKDLLAKAEASGSASARYLARTAQPGFPLWDEVVAAAWLDPHVVTLKTRAAIDVDLMQGANYGAILTWPAGHGPGAGEQDAELILRVDKPKVEAMFVDLLGR